MPILDWRQFSHEVKPSKYQYTCPNCSIDRLDRVCLVAMLTVYYMIKCIKTSFILVHHQSMASVLGLRSQIVLKYYDILYVAAVL